MDCEDEKMIKKLTEAIGQSYEHRKRLYLRQFLMGIFYGLGATIGAAVVFGLFGGLIRFLGGMPVIGSWFK